MSLKAFYKVKTFHFRLGITAVKITLYFALMSIVNAQYRLDSWTADNGLPQNSITGLTQTPDGYLWMTTNDGLVRFDGLSFKVFNTGNSPELTTNRLKGAFADKSGRLWFQGEDGGIGFYEKGALFTALKPGEISPFQFSPFFDDQKGGVIFSNREKNFRYENGGIVPFGFESLIGSSVVILADREGGLWFSNEKAIQRLKDGAVKSYELGEFGESGKIYKIGYEDRQGGIWLGYGGDFDEPSKLKLLRIKNDQLRSFEIPATPVWHFAEDTEGNLWITVFKRGIYRIESDALRTDDLSDSAIKPAAADLGISINSSGFLLADREGGMWIGTENGLKRLLPQTIRVFSKQDGLPEENVYPIYQDKSGNIMAGIWNNSLVKYENGSFKTVLKDENSFYITSLFQDSNNRLWFGSIDTLRCFEGGKPIKFTEQSGFRDYTQFSVIAEDKSGSLWFGTDKGLSRYREGQANIFTVRDGLPDNYIVALLETRDGKLWIGTRGGLASFKDGKFAAFTKADGLASNYIRSLYEDEDGALWIGGYDGGLTRLKNGAFSRFTKKDGLSSDGAFCILEDSRGWFWINSNQGIFRVSRQNLNEFADGKTKILTSIAYNKEDGLLNIEGNGGRQPAGIKAQDGRLWFPTAKGIAMIDPEKVIINSIPPPVIIEEISIDKTPVSNDAFQSAASNSDSAVTLTPDQNNLEINYTGLSFINSEQVKFKYKLEGLEREWNEVGIRRAAYYSYLPPGEYTFRVIAANRDGVWNDLGAGIKIRVLPPFYRTWWFPVLSLIGFIVLVFVVYRYRVGELKKKSLMQEDFARQLINSQELERGRIAADLHDGLSQSLVIIKNRAMLSLVNPDDHDRIIEQLKEIADASTYAIDEVKEIIYDLRPIQLDRLGLTGAIEELAEKIAEANDLKLVKRFDDIDDLFSKQSENSIYRIVQESLSNIIKHSEATVFEVEIMNREMHCQLIIKDNGKGFSIEEIHNSAERNGGFGLIGISERAKLLGGGATIESAYRHGTKVSVILPVTVVSEGFGKAGKTLK